MVDDDEVTSGNAEAVRTMWARAAAYERAVIHMLGDVALV